MHIGLVRHLLKRHAGAAAGVVDKDVHLAERLDDLLDGRLDLVEIGDIAHDRQAFVAKGADLLRNALELVGAAGQDGHIGTLTGQGDGFPAAEACGRARNNGNSSGKIKHGDSFLSYLDFGFLNDGQPACRRPLLRASGARRCVASDYTITV